MALPPAEPLFEHLRALRDAEDVHDPRHAPHWRGVDRWLAQAFGGGGAAADDRRQETLLALLRGVGTMRAESPLQAAKWVSTIHRRKRVDALRSVARDPIDRGLSSAPSRPDAPSPLERIEAPSEAPPADALDAVLTAVLEHVHLALEETVRSPRKRALRRTQAQAALLRLVRGWDAEAIADALDHGEPIGKDRLYKWVERGRAPVLEGLARWERVADDEEREAIAPALAVLRETMEARRADAGRARPDRRRDRSEGGP